MLSFLKSRLPLLGLLTVCVLATGGGTALAASPIDLGETQYTPNIAVDSTGNGNFTWATPSSGGTETLHYCGIPAGGGICSKTKSFAQVGEYNVDEGSAPLIDSSGNVLVISSRRGSEAAKFLYSSADGFASHTTVASETADFTDALYAPPNTLAASDRILTVEDGSVTDGGWFQATGTTGITANLFRLTGQEHSTEVESLAMVGNTLYAAYIDLSDGHKIYLRKYSGNGTLASLNASANWSAPAFVDTGDSNMDLVGGPGGLYILYDRSSDDAVVIRKFNGTAFVEEQALTGPGVINGTFAASEDSAGIVHLAWEESNGQLHYRYGHDSSNASFTIPQTLLTSGSFSDLELGVDAAGNGWLSWEDRNSSPPHALVMPIAPGEGPAPAEEKKKQPEYKGPTNTKSSSIGHGLSATLTTPKNCVPGGSIFKAKVGIKRKGSKAHKAGYTVKQVMFFLGNKLVSTDKKKPFEVSFATAGVPGGTTLTVSAKISVNLHLGPRRHTKVKKTLKADVKTCH